jgi:hypothetical protein
MTFGFPGRQDGWRKSSWREPGPFVQGRRGFDQVHPRFGKLLKGAVGHLAIVDDIRIHHRRGAICQQINFIGQGCPLDSISFKRPSMVQAMQWLLAWPTIAIWATSVNLSMR